MRSLALHVTDEFTPSADAEAAALVLSNAIDFLNAGLTMLFAESATGREAKVTIVSIQTAIEALGKIPAHQGARAGYDRAWHATGRESQGSGNGGSIPHLGYGEPPADMADLPE
jgi:hypothetical protein